MKVSVIVPLYNKASYVGRTLDSIESQSFSDYEVIVVDDGSTDDGAEIVQRRANPKVRLISQTNQGPGAARNRGIAEAAGQYLAFLDADDEWMPGFLENSLRLLEDHGPEVAAVSSGYVQYPAGQSMRPFWERRGLEQGVYSADENMSPRFLMHLLAYICPWNTVVRKETLHRHGGVFSRNRCVYGEDSFLWLKVLLNEKVAVNLEPLVRFHSEASQLSKNLQGPRPTEPILLYPEEVREACPQRLRSLLEQILALRAVKTACMLSYWGRWQEARVLLNTFYCGGSPNSLLRLLAQMCATPVGAAVGSACRLLTASRLHLKKTP
jgi:hypothetical protein